MVQASELSIQSPGSGGLEPRLTDSILVLGVSRGLVLRIATSMLLVFHLICLGVAPQRDSLLGNILGPFIDPYTQFLELEVSWSFFAPEPGPPPVFIEWEGLAKDGAVLSIGKFPESPDPYWIRERQNRRLLLARFMVLADHRTEGVMLPYLCRTLPNADSIRLWRTQYTIPEMRAVASGSRQIGDDFESQRRLTSHSFCPEAK